jgi:hypothetical protein
LIVETIFREYSFFARFFGVKFRSYALLLINLKGSLRGLRDSYANKNHLAFCFCSAFSTRLSYDGCTWLHCHSLSIDNHHSPTLKKCVNCYRKDDGYDTFTCKKSEHPLARQVKIGDLHDNMRSERLPHPDEMDLERLMKFGNALVFLDTL